MDKYNPIQTENYIKIMDFTMKNMSIYDKIKRT